MRYLLDANAVIALLNDTASKTAKRIRREKPGDVAISAIVAHELFLARSAAGGGRRTCL